MRINTYLDKYILWYGTVFLSTCFFYFSEGCLVNEMGFLIGEDFLSFWIFRGGRERVARRQSSFSGRDSWAGVLDYLGSGRRLSGVPTLLSSLDEEKCR